MSKLSEFSERALEVAKICFEGQAPNAANLKVRAGQLERELRSADQYASVQVIMEDNPGEGDAVFVTCDRAPASLQKIVTTYGKKGAKKLPPVTKTFEGQNDAVIIEFSCTITGGTTKALKFVKITEVG